jgi:integrase
MAKAMKLKSGNWRVQVFIGRDEGGKIKRKSFTARTKKEAEFAAAAFAAGHRAMTDPTEMTVGEAVTQYVDNQVNILSPSTVRGYRTIRRNAFSELMPVKLSRLRQAAVTRAVNVYALTHSPKTVRNAYGLLQSALKVYAPDLRLNTPLPQMVKKEISVPEQGQISALMAHVRGDRMEIPIVLAACLGLRRSEICALTGEDIDTTARTIRISKALVPNDKNEYVLKAPKSYAGTRTLSDVAPSILLILKPFEGSSDRVFPYSPQVITDTFRHIAKALGLNCTFHGLRHYNASIMLAMGVPDKYAMERLGQSTPGMLKRVYQHTMRDKHDEVSKQMKAAAEAILGGSAHNSAHAKNETL